MLYQPTNISPSMLGPLGNGVVDANEDFVVSWQVNGNSPMIQYQIQYQIQIDGGTAGWTITKTLDDPFYGTDYAGNVQMFRANLGTLNRLQNGKSYTMRIRQYWGNDEYVDQQSASSFITRDRPVVTITNPYDGEYLSSRKVTIEASYSQAQGDTLNWVRWRIAKMPDGWNYSSEPEEIIEDTGPIYGTAQLQYPFDGIFPGNGYLVQCTVQTQSGMEASSEWLGFYGEESGETIDAQITACAGGNAGGIRLTLPEATSLVPKFSGNDEPSTFQGELSLNYDSTLNYAEWGNYSSGTIATSPFNFAWHGSADINGPLMNLFTKGSGDRSPKQTYFNIDANMESSGTYTIYGSGTWRTVVCTRGSGKLYMALGDAGVAYSQDAKTWTLSTIPSALSGNLSALSLCEGYAEGTGNVFFLASSATTTAAYTEDGVTWTTVTMEKPVKNVFYAERFFAAYTDGTLAASVSPDEWTDTEFEGYSGSSAVSGVSFGNGIYVCIREDGTSAYCDNSNGHQWKTTGKISENEGSATFYGLCFANGKFFARSSSNVSYFSKNAILWTSKTSTAFLQNASGSNTVTNDTFFVVGSENQLLLGSTVRSWGICAEGTTGNWKSGCFDGENFVFVGSGGKAAIFRICLPFTLKYDHTQICSGTIYANNSFYVLLDGSKLYTTSDGGLDYREFSADFQWADSTELKLVQIVAEQTCYWVMVSDGNLSADDRDNLLGGVPYTQLNFPTALYTNFWGSANGGQYGTTGYNKFAIYRQDGDNESFRHVGDISVEDGNVLIDASAVNGKTYTYYAYGVGENYSDVIVSEAVHTCGWDWYLMACTQDGDGAYHVQRIFRFANNLSSGSVTNNAAPSVLQNFTRYPTVQNSPWNYRSGTLTSLIGYTADGKYYDTKELRDEITALTTSDYALFLKNRKGDVIRIAVSGAVEMETMDNSSSQAQTMKLPWTEIGDASDAQIIITKNDGAYLQAIPSPVVGGYCDCGSGAARSFAYPLTVLQSSGTTVYDGSEAKKVVIKDGGSGGIVAEDDGNGNITIY